MTSEGERPCRFRSKKTRLQHLTFLDTKKMSGYFARKCILGGKNYSGLTKTVISWSWSKLCSISKVQSYRVCQIKIRTNLVENCQKKFQEYNFCPLPPVSLLGKSRQGSKRPQNVTLDYHSGFNTNVGRWELNGWKKNNKGFI